MNQKTHISINDLFNEEGRSKGYLKLISFNNSKEEEPSANMICIRGVFRSYIAYRLNEEQCYNIYQDLKNQKEYMPSKDLSKYMRSDQALYFAIAGITNIKKKRGETPATPGV